MDYLCLWYEDLLKGGEVPYVEFLSLLLVMVVGIIYRMGVFQDLF